MAGAGDPAGEEAIYRAEAARRPQAWQPWWWLASWNQRAGRVDEAIRCYREMVRRAPSFHQGYTDLGGYLVLRGQYPQAIDTLKISLRLLPTQPAFDNLGSAYFNLGRFPEAVDAYNQSLQFGKADYRAWLNLGDAYYWQAGRKAQARDAYAQAVATRARACGGTQPPIREYGGRSLDFQPRDSLRKTGTRRQCPRLPRPRAGCGQCQRRRPLPGCAHALGAR